MQARVLGILCSLLRDLGIIGPQENGRLGLQYLYSYVIFYAYRYCTVAELERRGQASQGVGLRWACDHIGRVFETGVAQGIDKSGTTVERATVVAILWSTVL